MWSDTESKEDYLNFGEVSQIVTEILETEAMLPVSIGVFGNWGAGKSSLLNLMLGSIRDLMMPERRFWKLLQAI